MSPSANFASSFVAPSAVAASVILLLRLNDVTR